MKKNIILFIILISCIFLLTGCDTTSTLKCTINSNDIEKIFSLGFKNNKIETMNLQYKTNLSGYTKTQKDTYMNQDLCGGLISDMEEFKDAITDCSKKLEGDIVIITENFDIDKIEGNKTSKNQAPETVKKDLESSGYKCIIEK